MASFVQIPANGTVGPYTIPFPYLLEAHVSVRVGSSSQIAGSHFDYISPTQIQFRPLFMPTAGAIITIRRNTPTTPLVDFQNSAVLTEADLDTAARQALYVSEEIKDYYEARLDDGLSALTNGTYISANEALAAAVQSVLDSELLADLQARITDIDTNALGIAANTTAIANLQTQLDALGNFDGGGFAALIEAEETARVTADEAFASKLSLLGATNGEATAFILDLATVRVDATTTLGTRLSGIDSSFGSTNAALANEVTARANADSALSSSLSALSTTVTNNYSTLNSAISAEATARSTADSTNASNITTLTSTVTTLSGSVTGINTNLTALNAEVDALAGTVAGNYTTLSSAISTEQSTRASADSTNASSIATLASTVATNFSTLSATDTSEANARASGDATNAANITAVNNAVIAANAAITAEASTRASTDSALASSITTLSATVGGQSSAISTLQTVVSGSGGLSAQYMVKTDVNGYVSGFGLYNTGASSDFIVLADKFAIVTPGNTPKVPFVVTGGIVYMQNVVIGNALIENLTISKLTNGTLNADMNVGTGRIIWSNGSYMKVTGVGFGSSNQFIEWYGPYFASFASCTEANAISYLKTNGSAYFGGTLLAGVLRNAARTTNSVPNAFVEVGPFSTNGNSKTVTVSYALDYIAQTGSSASPGDPSITVRLYRKLDAGSYTEVSSQTFTGSRSSIDNTDIGVWEHNFDAAGSWTYTDTTGGTSQFTYKAEITSRSLFGTVLYLAQEVGVISIES